MKDLQDLLSGLDFTKFLPVQHKGTEAYYAINVAENPDFDEAHQNDQFRCYPVLKTGQPKFNTVVFLQREMLQPIPLKL